ncbi:367_t:CDS:2 [Scutellospora calospora]|uniref:367_t:CDS:1 n=1 Tax=Scutellospora calospora TaxID=85575 RepID=A0ACA9KYM9_9GLOM|nr:367_t:CDS:2 [Scutellospora calospora]
MKRGKVETRTRDGQNVLCMMSMIHVIKIDFMTIDRTLRQLQLDNDNYDYIRGQPKKSGAGNGNWGVLGDEINVIGQFLTSSTLAINPSSHIRVITAEEFGKIKVAAMM